MYHFRALAFAALLSAANAARMKVEVHDKFHDPEEKVAAVTVCEDDAIWEQIMASPDVSSIRAIPWKTIGDSMENYLESEGMIISSLQSDIQKLQREISDKKTAAVSKMLSDEQIQELITGSVSSDGSYGSLETAKKNSMRKAGQTTACSSRLHGGCNRQRCCPCKTSLVYRRVQMREWEILGCMQNIFGSRR
jgi:hypothetical protein